MLAVNGHAKHRQSLCRVGYGKTALSMDLYFITTANILSTHTFLLLSQVLLFGLQKAKRVNDLYLLSTSFAATGQTQHSDDRYPLVMLSATKHL